MKLLGIIEARYYKVLGASTMAGGRAIPKRKISTACTGLMKMLWGCGCLEFLGASRQGTRGLGAQVRWLGGRAMPKGAVPTAVQRPMTIIRGMGDEITWDY